MQEKGFRMGDAKLAYPANRSIISCGIPKTPEDTHDQASSEATLDPSIYDQVLPHVRDHVLARFEPVMK